MGGQDRTVRSEGYDRCVPTGFEIGEVLGPRPGGSAWRTPKEVGDCLDEVVRAVGLRQEYVGSGRDRGVAFRWQDTRARDDDRDRSLCAASPEFANQVEPVPVRQSDVHHDDFGRLGGDQSAGILQVRRIHHSHISKRAALRSFERHSQESQDGGVVLDDEDHARRGGGGDRADQDAPGRSLGRYGSSQRRSPFRAAPPLDAMPMI